MKAAYAFLGFMVGISICTLYEAPPKYKLIAVAIIVAGAMAGGDHGRG